MIRFGRLKSWVPGNLWRWGEAALMAVDDIYPLLTEYLMLLFGTPLRAASSILALLCTVFNPILIVFWAVFGPICGLIIANLIALYYLLGSKQNIDQSFDPSSRQRQPPDSPDRPPRGRTVGILDYTDSKFSKTGFLSPDLFGLDGAPARSRSRPRSRKHRMEPTQIPKDHNGGYLGTFKTGGLKPEFNAAPDGSIRMNAIDFKPTPEAPEHDQPRRPVRILAPKRMKAMTKKPATATAAATESVYMSTIGADTLDERETLRPIRTLRDAFLELKPSREAPHHLETWAEFKSVGADGFAQYQAVYPEATSSTGKEAAAPTPHVPVEHVMVSLPTTDANMPTSSKNFGTKPIINPGVTAVDILPRPVEISSPFIPKPQLPAQDSSLDVPTVASRAIPCTSTQLPPFSMNGSASSPTISVQDLIHDRNVTPTWTNSYPLEMNGCIPMPHSTVKESSLNVPIVNSSMAPTCTSVPLAEVCLPTGNTLPQPGSILDGSESPPDTPELGQFVVPDFDHAANYRMLPPLHPSHLHPTSTACTAEYYQTPCFDTPKHFVTVCTARPGQQESDIKKWMEANPGRTGEEALLHAPTTYTLVPSAPTSSAPTPPAPVYQPSPRAIESDFAVGDHNRGQSSRGKVSTKKQPTVTISDITQTVISHPPQNTVTPPPKARLVGSPHIAAQASSKHHADHIRELRSTPKKSCVKHLAGHFLGDEKVGEAAEDMKQRVQEKERELFDTRSRIVAGQDVSPGHMHHLVADWLKLRAAQLVTPEDLRVATDLGLIDKYVQTYLERGSDGRSSTSTTREIEAVLDEVVERKIVSQMSDDELKLMRDTTIMEELTEEVSHELFGPEEGAVPEKQSENERQRDGVGQHRAEEALFDLDDLNLPSLDAGYKPHSPTPESRAAGVESLVKVSDRERQHLAEQQHLLREKRVARKDDKEKLAEELQMAKELQDEKPVESQKRGANVLGVTDDVAAAQLDRLVEQFITEVKEACKAARENNMPVAAERLQVEKDKLADIHVTAREMRNAQAAAEAAAKLPIHRDSGRAVAEVASRRQSDRTLAKMAAELGTQGAGMKDLKKMDQLKAAQKRELIRAQSIIQELTGRPFHLDEKGKGPAKNLVGQENKKPQRDERDTKDGEGGEDESVDDGGFLADVVGELRLEWLTDHYQKDEKSLSGEELSELNELNAARVMKLRRRLGMRNMILQQIKGQPADKVDDSKSGNQPQTSRGIVVRTGEASAESHLEAERWEQILAGGKLGAFTKKKSIPDRRTTLGKNINATKVQSPLSQLENASGLEDIAEENEDEEAVALWGGPPPARYLATKQGLVAKPGGGVKGSKFVEHIDSDQQKQGDSSGNEKGKGSTRIIDPKSRLDNGEQPLTKGFFADDCSPVDSAWRRQLRLLPRLPCFGEKISEKPVILRDITAVPDYSQKGETPVDPADPKTVGSAPFIGVVEITVPAIPCTWSGCKQVFTRADSLQKHIGTHMAERMKMAGIGKPLVCTWPGCKKIFYNEASMKNHLILHYRRWKNRGEDAVNSTTSRDDACLCEILHHSGACFCKLLQRTCMEQDEESLLCTWPGCTLKFAREEHLQRHLEMHNKAQKRRNESTSEATPRGPPDYTPVMDLEEFFERAHIDVSAIYSEDKELAALPSGKPSTNSNRTTPKPEGRHSTPCPTPELSSDVECDSDSDDADTCTPLMEAWTEAVTARAHQAEVNEEIASEMVSSDENGMSDGVSEGSDNGVAEKNNGVNDHGEDIVAPKTANNGGHDETAEVPGDTNRGFTTADLPLQSVEVAQQEIEPTTPKWKTPKKKTPKKGTPNQSTPNGTTPKKTTPQKTTPNVKVLGKQKQKLLDLLQPATDTETASSVASSFSSIDLARAERDTTPDTTVSNQSTDPVPQACVEQPRNNASRQRWNKKNKKR